MKNVTLEYDECWVRCYIQPFAGVVLVYRVFTLQPAKKVG
jgi:hypothetical protein